MKAGKKRRVGSAMIKHSFGNEDPVETCEMIKTDVLADYEGAIGETGVLVGISLPLPAPKGQRMGPWAKVDVTVTMPCANNPEDLKETSKFCQEFAQQRVTDIVKDIISRQK